MPGLAAEVANLIVALKLDDSGFSGKLNNVAGQLRTMDRGLSQMGRGIGQVGSGIGRMADRAALAAAGGLTAVVTTAASYEQAFTGVEKTVDATDQQFRELEETLKRMAGATGTSFEELAAIGEAGGALGVGVSDLEAFIDVVNRLAVSTNLSTDQAATALGQLGNILDLSGEEMRGLGDMLVALGNAGASTEDQIVDMAARFAAAGNSAGLSTADILALSSAVASMGIEVEAGGSSLSRLFNQTTTNIGTTSKKAKAFADALGMTFDEFKTAWDRDALGTFEDLLKHLNELDQFEGAALLKDIGITNTRDINAIMLMAQNYDFLGDQMEIAAEAQGALNEESDKFFGTTAANWDKVKQNARNALDTIGQSLLPIVNEQMEEFVDWLNQAETQRGIKAFASDLAEGVGDLIDELKGTDFSGIVGGLKLAAEVAKGAFDAFRALPEPIQQLAVAALVANKVTGGALGQIAGGLANIFGGALKTIYAGHVTVIGGGGGGVPTFGGGGGGAGGLANLLKGALKIALPLVIGYELGSFISDLGHPSGGKNLGNVGNRGKTGSGGTSDDALLQQFGGKLDTLATNEVIEALGRTTEIGLKGVGTSFQVGITTGLDPIGDIATRILASAEDPKAPAVMHEIQGHLSGLEEIQQQYLSTGDVHLAQKVQTNIDTLHALIGTTDDVKAVNEYMRQDAAAADQNLISLAQRANDYGSRTAAASEATSRKNFDPKIRVDNNITIPVAVAVNARVVQQELTRLRISTNSGGFI